MTDKREKSNKQTVNPEFESRQKQLDKEIERCRAWIKKHGGYGKTTKK